MKSIGNHDDELGLLIRQTGIHPMSGPQIRAIPR